VRQPTTLDSVGCRAEARLHDGAFRGACGGVAGGDREELLPLERVELRGADGSDRGRAGHVAQQGDLTEVVTRASRPAVVAAVPRAEDGFSSTPN